MKTSTLLKRIEKRVTLSKTSVSYKVLMDLANDTNFCGRFESAWLIRPTTSGFSNGRGKVNCYETSILSALKLVGLKVENGNDAPRGGAAGNYIKVLTKIVN
jgi:hypothetical protein